MTLVSSVVLLILLVRVTMTMVWGIQRVMTIALVIRRRRLGRSHLCLDPGITSSAACGRKRRLVH